jgi:hypothetical protein
MIELAGINILAVLVAWLINIGLGSFWYSPAGFGKLWSKLSGVNMMDMPKDLATKAIISVAIASLIQTIVLAIVINSLGVADIGQAVLLGLLLWAGFTAATTVGNTLYSRLSWKFWWLNVSFFLIVMVLNTVLLTAWN